jgi:hypothetical protein
VVPDGKLLVVEHIAEGWPYGTAPWWTGFLPAARVRIQSFSCQCTLYQVCSNSVLRKASVDGINSAHRPGYTCAPGKSLVVSGGSSKTEGSPDPSATISLFASAIEHLLDE